MASKEVQRVAQPHRYDDDELAAIGSIEDAVALMQREFPGVSIASISDELGTGFEVLETSDKVKLVNEPLFLLSWQFNQGDQGEFVSAVVITLRKDRYIVNDGSTGIYQQLIKLTDKRENNGHPTPFGNLTVPKGLRFSTYATCKACGKPRPSVVNPCPTCSDESTERSQGTTFYLNTSA